MPKNNKTSKLRIIFMGTSALAETILKSLIKEKYNIAAVITQPDKKANQKKELKASPVKNLAEQNKILIFQPEKFDKDVISEIKKIKPDLIIVAAYGKILPREVLEIPGFGSLNIHASLLPKFRGPSPIQNVLMAGEKETGVTIMLMDEGIDTGDILTQKKIEINSEDNFKILSLKLSELSTKLLLETIPLWIERKIENKKQDESQTTLCQLIERDDGRIFWDEKAKVIYNKYRALSPWPGIFCFWESDDHLERIKFHKISIREEDHQNKYRLGEVFQLEDDIGIKSSEGFIIIKEIQLEGKNPLPIKEFINGHPDFIGSVLK